MSYPDDVEQVAAPESNATSVAVGAGPSSLEGRDGGVPGTTDGIVLAHFLDSNERLQR